MVTFAPLARCAASKAPMSNEATESPEPTTNVSVRCSDKSRTLPAVPIGDDS